MYSHYFFDLLKNSLIFSYRCPVRSA